MSGENQLFQTERQLLRATLANDGWRPARSAGCVRIRGAFLASLIAGAPRVDWPGPAANATASLVKLEHDIEIDGDDRLEIDGSLILTSIEAAARISLRSLRFLNALALDGARLKSLSLKNISSAGAFSAKRAHFDHAFEARDLEIGGAADFSNATFDQDFTIDQLKQFSPTAEGLSGVSITVKGRLIIRGLEDFAFLDLSDCKVGRSAILERLRVVDGLSLRNANIGGDLSISNLSAGSNLPAESKQKPDAPNSGFPCGVNFNGANVGGSLQLSAARVASNEYAVDARGVHIGGSVGFGDRLEKTRVCVQGGGVSLRDAEIGADLDLQGLSIHGAERGGVALYVREAVIGGTARLDGDKEDTFHAFEATNGAVLFHSCQIDGGMLLSGSFIGGFNKNYHNSLAIYDCRIDGKLDISRFRRFDRERRLIFLPRGDRRPHFDQGDTSCAPATGDWSMARLISFAHRVSPKITIYQTQANIFEIGFPKTGERGDNWNLFDLDKAQLSLTGFDFTRLEESTTGFEDWKGLLSKNNSFTDHHQETCLNERRFIQCDCARKAPFDAGPWSVASRTLALKGLEDEARRIRFEREKRQYAADWAAFWKAPLYKFGMFGSLVWRLSLLHFIGFGFKPFRAVWNTILALALGVIVYSCGFQSDLAPLDSASLNGSPSSPEFVPFDALIYAIDVFFPILDFGQEGFWRPTTQSLAAFNLFLSIWGWLTFTFGALALTPLVKRT